MCSESELSYSDVNRLVEELRRAEKALRGKEKEIERLGKAKVWSISDLLPFLYIKFGEGKK